MNFDVVQKRRKSESFRKRREVSCDRKRRERGWPSNYQRIRIIRIKCRGELRGGGSKRHVLKSFYTGALAKGTPPPPLQLTMLILRLSGWWLYSREKGRHLNFNNTSGDTKARNPTADSIPYRNTATRTHFCPHHRWSPPRRCWRGLSEVTVKPPPYR